MTDAGVTKPRKEHHFTGAEISGFFFPLGFLQSLLKSPAGCGGHQTSQKPVRAAQGPRADRHLSLSGWEPGGSLGSRQHPCRVQALTFSPTGVG